MEIKSDTQGKLLKIKEGKVFSDRFTFMKELLQNAQRSKAKRVDIEIENGVVVVTDDGVGCDEPENILTLDYSSWESTKEGFGIGFWSVLSIPDIKTITVSSHRWSATIDAVKLFDYGDLSVDILSQEYRKGFRVFLSSPEYFGQPSLEYELKEYLRETVKYLPFDTYFCGEKLRRTDLLDDYQSEYFTRTFNHRGYKVKMSVAPSFEATSVYYDNRKVESFWQINGRSGGVVSISPGKINLKEPDRTEPVRDALFYQFVENFEKDRRLLYLQYILEEGVDNSEMVSSIDEYLEPADYMRFLNIDVDGVTSKDCTTKEFVDVASVIDPSLEQEQPIKPVFAGESFAEEDYHAVQMVGCANNKKRDGGNFVETIRALKHKACWVGASEVEDYSDFVAEIKYLGMKVVVAKNILYEKALEAKNIPHISSMKDHLFKEIERKNVELKNGKEVAFIKALAPICREFDIPLTCFKIANLSEKTEFLLDGKCVFRRVIKNKAWDVRIYGETDGKTIYLDRTALALKNYNIRGGDGIGLNEVKAVLNAMPTIAHELAHFLYGTTDNTVDHYKKIEEISHRIGKCYNK